MFAPHLGYRCYYQERMLLDYLALGLLWSHVSASLLTLYIRLSSDLMPSLWGGFPPNEWRLSGMGWGR